MPALHSRTIKKFFLQFKILGCTIGQPKAGLKKIVTESNKTWNVDICIVGLLCRRLRWGDWLGVWGQKTKVGSSSGKVLWRTWDQATSCRPQGKLKKRQSRFSKSQTGGKSKQNVHYDFDYLPLSTSLTKVWKSPHCTTSYIQLWSTKA